MRPKKPFEGHPRNPERPKKRFESHSRTESARKNLWKATLKISGDRKNVSEATSKTSGDQKSDSEATQEIQSRPLNPQMSTPKIQNDRGTAPTLVLRTSTRGQSLGRPPSKSPQERHRPHLHRAISSAPHPKRWHRNTQSGPPSSDSMILVLLPAPRRSAIWASPMGRDRRARRAGQTSYSFRLPPNPVCLAVEPHRSLRPHRGQLQHVSLPIKSLRLRVSA